jgi:hypothetical protein
MMAVYVLSSVTTWAAACYKLRDLLKDPRNPILRAFCVTIVLLAVETTLRVAAIGWRFGHVSRILVISTTGLTMLVCAALQTTVLLWTHPPQQARLKIRARLPLYGVAIIVMVVLALQVPLDTARIELPGFSAAPELLYGRTPYAAESVAIYLVTVGYTTTDAAWHFLCYARIVDRRWLRRGLRVMAVGSMLLSVCCVASLVFVAALRLDFAVVTGAERAAILLGGVAVSVGIVGATMPVWGPKLHRLRAYRQLRPLWLALSQAAPEVVLDPPNSRRWRIRDLDFRLYRRIIEIRDSRLALRPYLDQDVATAARQLGQEANLEGDALRATIEASVLAGAVRAKARGRPAQAHPMDETPGGTDLAGELAWLTDVAKAFVGSPVVAAVAAVAAHPDDRAGQGIRP